MSRFPLASLSMIVLLAAPARLGLAQPAEEDVAGHIYIAKADGSDPRPLPNLTGYDRQGSPCWSADGRLLAFDAWRRGQGETYINAKIVVVNADGTNPRILCDGAMPSFSPQGKRIAFSRYSPNHGVWVMSTEGPEKELVLIDEDGWSARWSPDGKQIAYTSYDDDGANFVTFDLIEGVTTRLFEQGMSGYQDFFHNFAWSPDGRQIVFKGQRADGKLGVGIIDIHGARHGLVVRHEGSVSANFAWDRVGGRILLTKACPERGGRLQVYSLDPKTNEPPQLLVGQDPYRNNGGVAISPDGTSLAIASQWVAKKAATK